MRGQGPSERQPRHDSVAESSCNRVAPQARWGRPLSLAVLSSGSMLGGWSCRLVTLRRPRRRCVVRVPHRLAAMPPPPCVTPSASGPAGGSGPGSSPWGETCTGRCDSSTTVPYRGIRQGAGLVQARRWTRSCPGPSSCAAARSIARCRPRLSARSRGRSGPLNATRSTGFDRVAGNIMAGHIEVPAMT